ncbi:NADH:flavin oxidoreductase/NADH oxidase family protein [Aspergillus ibericus CBS 121593]|uniref:FMN binding oxidoreductase n=1 Tax=Aspergillus ibericus CBS 121593 TaxID=1448316 RepID=A0A395GJF4_9EURO|nr:FMN binding oxidoreductase [Aspergillus ibericus CBS 121593]RAK95178.1 FMN binding oxidoreductase [Aspergillus ibericus CBS 121593]
MASLHESVRLPCGLVFPNRLAKAAMAESLAGSVNAPTPTLLEAYNQWSQGGWGALLTGNVQVDVDHLGTPRDVALHAEYTGKEGNEALVENWTQYAQTCQQHGTPCIVQVCHPGRQSLRFAGRRGIFAPPIAPSAVPMQMGDGLVQRLINWLVFPPPREMTQADIDRVTRQFVDAARLMADSGFAGIELHGAHGYLIDQFLNSKSNKRTDAYGGSAENRAKFVVDMIHAIREAVPPTFAVGIKLNSADHSSSTFEDTMTQIQLLTEAGIDFLEVSGGSYENPTMMGPEKSQRTVAREAFFIEFATETRKRFPNLVLMLTGGFRTRAGAESALKQNACDVVGIGRPAAINPKLPLVLLDESIPDEEAQLILKRVPMPFLAQLLSLKGVGAGLESSFYAKQIRRLAMGLKTFVPA